ncbi:hypothetical protein FIV50_08500 [Microbacterium foliorum]|uniref:Integral membrane protein n=1 Tax=Microbacterium foliorum TaxID=104336 RepID=A0A4Y5YQE7_9MICO|nr:hypothetical protein [Microbacterium foliorum]QDE34828.1 hypothetical protein FIV50_08500 [Microbacterium foliorum]
MSELDDLRSRVRALEQENASLRTPRRRPISVRSVTSGIVLVLALLMSPLAAVGTWARTQLVDTDQFVATFAPLAEDPQVQDFIADQVVVAIDEQLDVESLVSDVFDGIRGLDLAPRAEAALGILELPAAQGISSLIDGVVHDLVASDQFAAVWTESLRFTHDRAVAVLQDDPAVAVQLGSDGVISVDLGIVIERVKDVLTERGIGFADLIPVIEKSVPIAQTDALLLVRTVYQIAVVTGFWLPWLVLTLLIAGILLARRRSHAIFLTSTCFAVIFGLVAAGVGLGRTLFISGVSPAILPSGAARVLYDQIIELLQGAVVALAFLGVIAAVWSWTVGSSNSASTVRMVAGSTFAAVRGLWERKGVDTGRLGIAIERFRQPILLIGVAVGVLILVASRPVSVGSVISVVLGLLVLLVLVELIRRPETLIVVPEPTNPAVRRTPAP